MSSSTLDSQQLAITKSKRRKGGGRSGSVPPNKSPSLRPDLMGRQFGRVKVISPEVTWRGKKWAQRRYIRVACVTCGKESSASFNWLFSKRPPGCSDCRKAEQIPPWILSRTKAQRLRCQDPSHPAYPAYGGRGIEFRFASPRAAAEWIRDNLGIPQRDRNLQLDRKDNNGHYEPHNLRWASKHLNVCNTRRGGWMAMVHKFRMEHPEIHYADKTLRNLISLGLTSEQIIERYHRPSDKPKGVYGTYLTPDPEIASLAKDF